MKRLETMKKYSIQYSAAVLAGELGSGVFQTYTDPKFYELPTQVSKRPS